MFANYRAFYAVIEYILPHLPPQTILALSLVSKGFYSLIFGHNGRYSLRTWRYLNLGESYITPLLASKKLQQRLPGFPLSPPPSPLPNTSYRFIQNPETILLKPYVFENVRTLILDGLPSVTAWFVKSLLYPIGINLPRIEILSIRDCPKVDDSFLLAALRSLPYPWKVPLKGIYYFSDPGMDFLPTAGGGAKVFVNPKWIGGIRERARINRGWAEVITKLKGKVAFDTETCRSVTHFQPNPLTNELEKGNLRVATMRLRKGCTGCGAHPEVEDHVAALEGDILIPPAPVHTSNLASAKCSRHLVGREGVRITLRCTECLDRRCCDGCGKWWCLPCAARLEEPFENLVLRTKRFPWTLCRECET